jgi:uncharacterized LabA/DUF88 family protein
LGKRAKRVIAYVDGFNLYFGLKSKGWRRYYWLNIRALAENLLAPDQELVYTKYFTSRVISPPDKQLRQSTFIEALETLSHFAIFYGVYQLNPVECHGCGFKGQVPNEKMTDVNIAVEMLKDAYGDRFDVALLISADSDLVPPVRAIRELFPSKRIVAAFPPGRSSINLANSAHQHFMIFRQRIARSVFPDEIRREDGHLIRRPSRWK